MRRKIEGKPLHGLLAGRHGGKVLDRCFVYVGGGWYAPGKGIPELQDEMKRHLDAGYSHGEDEGRRRAAR